jgi:hemerythrin-like domain-containing protein
MPQSQENIFALAARNGLPDDLLRLCKKYPRDTWDAHANLGDWVRFWLDRHRMFREVDTMITDGCQQLQGGQISIGDFSPWFAPRLEFLFSHLDLHHKIEEFHLFPVFAKAEPVLSHGFTLLEADHQAIHKLVDGLQEAASRLLAPDAVDGDLKRRAGDDTVRELAALSRGLLAHLDDEEDLIVPIVLDHTEVNLGLV